MKKIILICIAAMLLTGCRKEKTTGEDKMNNRTIYKGSIMETEGYEDGLDYSFTDEELQEIEKMISESTVADEKSEPQHKKYVIVFFDDKGSAMKGMYIGDDDKLYFEDNYMIDNDELLKYMQNVIKEKTPPRF